MDLDIFERLINGSLSENLIRYNKDFLINAIKSNLNRKMLIEHILEEYESRNLLLCFYLIYDLDEFEDKIMCFLEDEDYEYKNYLRGDKLSNFLRNTSFGKKYVMDNIKFIANNCSSNMDTVMNYAFSYDSDMIEKIANHDDMHVRYLFMNCLIEKYSDKLDSDYKYIFDYLEKSTEKNDESKMMDIYDISNLAVNALKFGNKELYKRLKDYILLNYKYNDLGEVLFYVLDSRMLSLDERDRISKEFNGDIDNLFLTSSRYNFQIYNNYRNLISNELVDNFLYYANIFKNEGIFDSKLSKICSYRLWHELTEYVDKYLSLSKDTTYGYVVSGSITSVYRIGDFAFKLCRGKYSKKKVITPNLYLIIKNLEEHYIRDEETNKVLAGIEVQRYLTRYIQDFSLQLMLKNLFIDELKGLGYFVDDNLIDGKHGDNLMLLDSYRDADCGNPEELPEWFKSYPAVLVDRDLVYKLEEKKKLKKYWYSDF